MTHPRASGILLHPTSLPSRYGIGDLGAAAYAFVDFLAESGQTWWQVLPLGPTGYDHSPYTMNFSAFAGNPLLISLDLLAEAGLVDNWALETLPVQPHAQLDQVDFAAAAAIKGQFLSWAAGRYRYNISRQPDPEFDQFCRTQSLWLEDYALFMALLEVHEGSDWNTWEPAIATRDPAALKAKAAELDERVFYYRFTQYQFFQQWSKLRAYAKAKNIQIIGDVSIYVCYNSADVWANPKNFQLDPQTLAPSYIAGVPPDYYSATGQLWCNPVYDWNHLQSTGFAWWIERFRATLQYVDVVRIDHFRGFEAYWRVPAGETTAIHGEWVQAPGEAFFQALTTRFGGVVPVMAEDLGNITSEVEALRDRFGFPGMRILQFGFGGDVGSLHLPHNYIANCVVYPGTHDNDTALGWWQTAAPKIQQHLAEYLGYDNPAEIDAIHWVLIRLALSSQANLAILPLQDVLGLDSSARMNDPSVNAGNWGWRLEDLQDLTPEIGERLQGLTELYGRMP